MRTNSLTRKSLMAVLLGGLLVASAIGCASSPGEPTSTSSTPSQYTVNVLNSPSLGEHLVDGMGFSLYWTTADGPNSSSVPDSLLGIWPIFYVSTISVPSLLKASDFGAITRTDGKSVTTYKGWPLYYYVNDTSAGQTNGQGLGGRWSVVAPGASGPQPSTPPPTTTPPPTATTTPPPTTTTTPPATTTTTPPPTGTSTTSYKTLASAGQKTFDSTCATCHGNNGQGTQICPVVMWGSGSQLGTYNGQTLFTDAQGMLTYMSSKMPLTAPGSLTHQQYIELLAYILVQDNLASPSTAFNESQLSSIAIK